MANEYQELAAIRDGDTDVVVTVSRMFQEDGGRGLEIVVERDGEIVDVFQSKNLIHPRTTTGPLVKGR